jgi:hypothetical protein
MKKQIRNRVMVLITGDQYEKLVKAGYNNMTPIVKLFGGPLTWLVTGIEDGILFGYGDIGHGCVEWGSLCNESELPTLRTGIAYLERDRNWKHTEGTQYLSLDTLIGT